MNDTRGLFYGSYLLAGLIATVLMYAERSVLVSSGLEDKFAENLTAVLYFTSGLFTLSAYFSSRTQSDRFLGLTTTSGNVWLFLLALFFFVVAGEEVSWGQRIFGWGTPETWAGINGHGETNLHNLLDQSQFSNERLMTLFILGYAIVMPLAERLSSLARAVIKWAGVPVPPPQLAPLFLVVLVTYRYLRFYHPPPDDPLAKPIREYQEAGYALVFVAVAISFFLHYWGRNRAQKSCV